MPRALSQILDELNAVYNPQRDVYNQQVALLPEQQMAQEKGLEQAKQDSFQEITNTANRRGLFYSGIPVAEQQKYTGATFLPAVANLRNNFQTRKFNLQDALAEITQKQYGQAYGIRQGELDTEAAMEAERNRARAAAGGASPGFGFGGQDERVLGASASATASQRANKGFNFTDAMGRPINAAQYAAMKGIPFRSLLQQMANAGDAGARSALGFVGNDFGADPRRITSQSQANLYYALTGRRIGVATGKPAPQQKASSSSSPFYQQALSGFLAR